MTAPSRAEVADAVDRAWRACGMHEAIMTRMAKDLDAAGCVDGACIVTCVADALAHARRDMEEACAVMTVEKKEVRRMGNNSVRECVRSIAEIAFDGRRMASDEYPPYDKLAALFQEIGDLADEALAWASELETELDDDDEDEEEDERWATGAS